MAKRPALTEDTFLQHLFAPKRNALPTGIRKTALSASRGRSKARVAAYNRMTGTSQETLRRSGMRDAYLKGETTLAQAKRALREVAVGKGYAKPSRTRQPVAKHLTQLDMVVAGHLVKVMRDAGKHVNADKVYQRVPYMPEDDKEGAQHWPVAKIKAYASRGDKLVIIEGFAQPQNPLWYH